jgi:putative flippase GtrA
MMRSSSIYTTFQQLVRFGLVGVTATMVHATVGVVAVRQLGFDGLSANAAGFAVAWWISFFGHHVITFQAQAEPRRAFRRFIPHSALMFAVGMSVAAFVSLAGPHQSDALLPVIGACAVPILSFLSSKFIVFRA